uniref:Mitochondrial import inner membrane translocase subunit TIM22 n=2 Tax=Phytophthora ramorum TaxID=164328 RepID=H3H2B6_PHYRM
MAANGADDANARLGVHVADLSKETPPNPFLFPRSFLKMHLLHDTVGIHPFLPAYPPQILQWQQPNPIVESCAGKFFLSAAMGYVMGNVFGLVLGSYEGITPPVPLPGQRELPKVPWRESVRYNSLAIVPVGDATYLSLCCPAMFSGLECASEKIRGRHDVGNELVAGCATGAALAAGQGIQAQCLGCAGFAAFSYAINVFTGGKF